MAPFHWSSIMSYRVDDVLEKLQVDKTRLAELLEVHNTTPYSWVRKFDGIIPESHNEKIAALLSEPPHPETIYKVEDVLAQSGLTSVKLAKVLGVHVVTVNKWKHKGKISPSYNKAIKKLLENPQEVKMQKDIVVHEVQPSKAPQEDTPMVALVGKSKDILAVLSQLKLTKD